MIKVHRDLQEKLYITITLSRCICHILNLVIKIIIQEYTEINILISKLRAWIGFGKTGKRKLALKEFLGVSVLALDVSLTRWNSWFGALEFTRLYYIGLKENFNQTIQPISARDIQVLLNSENLFDYRDTVYTCFLFISKMITLSESSIICNNPIVFS